jgi:predicted nucleic-acid-binding Zn-ribbon protein
MRFPWQTKVVERTCGDCGYAWQVPRSSARKRVGTINAWRVAPTSRQGATVDRSELRSEVDSIAAMNQAAESLRQCPKCGADHFNQRPVRS